MERLTGARFTRKGKGKDMSHDPYLSFLADTADTDSDTALSLLLQSQDYGRAADLAATLAPMTPAERETTLAAASLTTEQRVAAVLSFMQGGL